MKDYQIKILSNIDKKNSIYTVIGDLQRNSNNCVLCYSQKENDVRLEISNSVKMIKKGTETIELYFQQGKYSKGKLVYNNNIGDISIFTEKIYYKYNEMGILLFLDYQLIFPNQIQKVSLRLTAKKI